jgi:hypothetical protein
MAIDFSDYSDLIPTITAVLQMRIRYGDGADGVSKRTKAGDGEGLDLEYVVLEGPHAKRKFSAFLLLDGQTDGQKQMAEHNKAFLKKVLDSAKYLDPSDKADEARKARTITSYRDLDGVRFLAEVGVEAGKNGYSDRNVVAKVITKDKPEWAGRPPIDQVAPDYAQPGGAAASPTAGQASATPASIKKPEWAK